VKTLLLSILVPLMALSLPMAHSAEGADRGEVALQRIVEARAFDVLQATRVENPYRNIALEPWTYRSDFSDRTLGAWAAYPLWQDTAYDPNFRTNEIIDGDPNVSIVQKVTPFASVDNYAGAQKLLDMFLTPDSEVTFRYYLKTHLDAEFVKVRFAAGEHGKLDVTLPVTRTNEWVTETVTFSDFVRENPSIAGEEQVRIYALAFLTKVPKADPKMNIYFGLDDIVFKGQREAHFQFATPNMHKLPEFSPYIPDSHYFPGDTFELEGRWPVNARQVNVRIANLTDESNVVYEGQLRRSGDTWRLNPIRLNFPLGLYKGTLTAMDGNTRLAETEFTIHVSPENIGGQHPRLRMNEERVEWMMERFQEPRFRDVYEDIQEQAARQRERVPVESLIYDLDQFPDETWLPSWGAWGSRIYHTGEAVKWNSRAYAFHGDREAGEYVRDVLLAQASWPDFTHPWQTKRGRFSEHRTGRWSHPIAEAYDFVYDLLTPEESEKIRRAFMENIVKTGHRTYVYNNNITPQTSNWIAHVIGGTLIIMAAIYQDGPDTENLEPYFTGAMLKFWEFMQKSTATDEGGYGEGLGYYSSSMSNLVESVPALQNVFNIDTSRPFAGTYREYIWGGLLEQNRWFEVGQSGSSISPARRSIWAWLVESQPSPLLGWWYNHLKEDETFEDVLFETRDIEQEGPFAENPVNLFREIGTTVFRSGWSDEDFIFTLRTGPFYNHQHHDQGAMWLADRGEIFVIGARSTSDSGRYNDPLFEPVHIQPVSKSTILIDNNPTSQRIGDHLDFAPGFHDHGFVDHFLDGQDASFSTGDIGRVYWNMETLRRNAFYLKPGVLLMLDTADAGKEDRDVTLLFHTEKLDHIQASNRHSTITRGDATMNVLHLAPEFVESRAVETPHFLRRMQNVQPLERSGKLTVTARTQRTHSYPLVIANLFTTTDTGRAPAVETERGDGFVQGVVSGREFAFSTRPGVPYNVNTMRTDALALTWNEGRLFVAEATRLHNEGRTVLVSNAPVTFERDGNEIKLYRGEAGAVRIGVSERPSRVEVNGAQISNVPYNGTNREITVQVPKGESRISIR